MDDGLLKFDLVSPEKKLASLEALSVIIPGAEGDMTALPNHAMFLTTLRPGILKVNKIDGVEEYLVTGGFAEISKTGASVLAENSMLKQEVTSDFLAELLSEAEKEGKTASEGSEALLALRVNDIKTLMEVFD